MRKIPDGKGLNVPSKTSEEIKKWLECCSSTPIKCHECPCNKEDEPCDGYVIGDTLALINRLEGDNIAKAIVLEQLERERDAAVEILRSMHCDTCIHDKHDPIPNECLYCVKYCNWEWQGVKEENDENTRGD